MYSDLFLQQQTQGRFPKVFLVAIIALVGLVASQVFVWYANVPTLATDVRLIQQIPVNLTDTEAGIFIETNESVETSILYGESSQSMKTPAYPTGSSFGSGQKSQYHLISMGNLKPATTYYFQILSDGKLLSIGSDDAFSFATQGTRTMSQSARQPIYGKVVTPDGLGLRNAYVLIHLPKLPSQPNFLTISKESGEWLFAMPTNLVPTDSLSLDIIHEEYPTSRVNTVMAKAAPIPQSVVIGTDYTYTADTENVLPASTRRTDEAAFPISLLYPKKDAVIPDGRPLFKGFGVPNTNVVVQVNSQPQYEGKTTINAQGAWVVEASRPFTPGNYTVVVALTDNLGQSRTISRTFTIAKDGEKVLGESNIATPSGSLAPTRPVTPSPNVTQPAILTATPMPTNVVYITATPNPTIFASITPTELEKAGGEVPLAWIIFGSLFLSGGIFLVRLNPHFNDH